VFQDTGRDEAGAINFQTLINKDKVVGIVGPTLSQQAFSADPPSPSVPKCRYWEHQHRQRNSGIGDYIARVSAPVSIVAPNSVKAALKKQNQESCRVYAQNDAFNKSETEIFQQTVGIRA